LKPIVDGIEKEFENRLIIIRLNIQEKVGRELAPRYGFQYTPTFIFFDSKGNEVWREVGSLDVERVRRSVTP
jgi:thioredoxin-related protein